MIVNRPKLLQQNSFGFTIVELLIVIVVIGILAAITIVTYSGMRDKADDAIIKSDISNLSKKIQSAAVESGEFPAGGAINTGGVVTGNSTTFPGFNFKPTKASYMDSVSNLFYCTGVSSLTNEPAFSIFARSRSGRTFKYSSVSSTIEDLGNSVVSNSSICTGFNLPQTWSYGYIFTSKTWYSWTN